MSQIGVSQIADIRFPGCSSTPCTVSSGQQVNLEVDFRPRNQLLITLWLWRDGGKDCIKQLLVFIGDMHWDLTQRGILLKEAQLVELSDGPVPDSTVQPGQLYTFRYPFTVTSAFSGVKSSLNNSSSFLTLWHVLNLNLMMQASELRLKVYQNYVMEIFLVIQLNIVWLLTIPRQCSIKWKMY